MPIVNGHVVCCSWATLSSRVQVSGPTVVDHRDPQLLGMSNQISLISPISLIWPDVGGISFRYPQQLWIIVIHNCWGYTKFIPST